MRKTTLIKIFVILELVSLLYMQSGQQSVRAEEETFQVPTNIVVGDRIAKQVAVLKTLSAAETMRLLDQGKHYEWPGAFIGAGTIFLWDSKGNIAADSLYEKHKIDVDRVLSNRVFRKALQDVSNMPKNQVSALLKKELDITLRGYLELYNGFFKSQSLGFSTLTSKDGKPVLHGLRYKVFSLLLIAGSLELTDIHDYVVKITDIAHKQRGDILRIEAPNVRRSYSLNALLDNNLVLASALYGTAPQKGNTDLKPFTDRFADHQLVDYSAYATEYDMLLRVPNPTPDKEYINVRYFDQMTDKDFGELCRVLRLP